MIALWILLALLGAVAVYDLVQSRHAILRSYPLIGHLRYLLEAVGPELRQYIVTSNNEERPFSRDQRRWVYASSKGENNNFGFGTDNDLEHAPNYLIIEHSAFPLPQAPLSGAEYDARHRLPCAKVLGGPRGRARAFRPDSIVNVSAMSFGSLSGRAIEALNRGSALAGCLQNTGEGGISSHHRMGGELVWQIGTGYFGCREPDGRFSLARLKDEVGRSPVRALEIKLSQGAKPGKGGILPAAKITPEIAAIRGVPLGRDCISPSGHTAFSDVDSLLDFVERLAEETGLPVGIKSAVGDPSFWVDLARAMVSGARGLDFITVDGGEGGTGAAPLVFSDHVALPFKVGFARVYRILAERGLCERIVLVGSGKLGFPENALLALGMGCDLINVGREAMLSIGCIQAMRCHTDHCPTGVATHNRWLVRGLDPTLKAARFANYVSELRQELMQLAHACGEPHPALVPLERIQILDGRFGATPATKVFGYEPGWGLPTPEQRRALIELVEHTAEPGFVGTAAP